MPDVDGLAVLTALLALPEPPAVSMLTSFGADTYVCAALSAGALGFLLKDTSPDQLIAGVRLLLALTKAADHETVGPFPRRSGYGNPSVAAVDRVR
nr:response regulator [Streptomyces sp. BA2]